MTKQRLENALRSLGVVSAASSSDPIRWSVSDLATDLHAWFQAPENNGHQGIADVAVFYDNEEGDQMG